MKTVMSEKQQAESSSDETEYLSSAESDNDEFEDQGSSSEDENESEQEEEDEMTEREKKYLEMRQSREEQIQKMRMDGTLDEAKLLHNDDLSSDDEETRNTIGNVPLRWYEDYDHIGYDVDGKKIVRKNAPDTIDQAIAARDDPNFSRTIYDAYNDRQIVLSDRDMELIRRIQAGAFAHPEHNAYPEYVPYFSSKKEIHAFGNDIEPKSRFITSKWERMRVMKIVQGIKEGRIQLDKPVEKKPDVYELWKEDDQPVDRKGPAHVPPPKMALPGHAESYNPPDEYLFTEEEKKAWEEMDPSDREIDFIPQKFSSLRAVSGYQNFVRERFERCLDLYLCPRVNKKRLNIDPESLVPQLPKPRDLRPFPNTLALLYKGHTGRIRSLSMGPEGQYFVSGSDDCTVRLWEVETGRCLNKWTLEEAVHKVVWNPNKEHHVVAVASGKNIYLIATGTGSAEETELTDAFLSKESAEETEIVQWQYASDQENDIRLTIEHKHDVKSLAWHNKGDYLSSVCPEGASSSVLIHQISKQKTQNPFSKNKGMVQCVAFHPTQPYFFHATKSHIRIYNLKQHSMMKKLLSNAKWISSMSIHPSGDHVLVGSYDRRLCWFDLDLASTPYKTLKYHEKAIRDVAYHPRYPLMASASDDGTMQIFHCKVFSDLTKNPLIVPLKILRGHQVSGGLGVMSLVFHPKQPWVCSGGADGTIRLFQSIH